MTNQGCLQTIQRLKGNTMSNRDENGATVRQRFVITAFILHLEISFFWLNVHHNERRLI